MSQVMLQLDDDGGRLLHSVRRHDANRRSSTQTRRFNNNNTGRRWVFALLIIVAAFAVAAGLASTLTKRREHLTDHVVRIEIDESTKQQRQPMVRAAIPVRVESVEEEAASMHAGHSGTHDTTRKDDDDAAARTLQLFDDRRKLDRKMLNS